MDAEQTRRLGVVLEKLLDTLEELQDVIGDLTTILSPRTVSVDSVDSPKAPRHKLVTMRKPMRASKPLDSKTVTTALTGSDELTKGERKVLVALAQIGKPAPAMIVGLVARVSHKTGPFGTTLASLRRDGLITGPVSALSITVSGHEAIGDFAPLPRGFELFEYWCNKLPGSCGKILKALKSSEHPITSEEVGSIAGISASTGPFGTALATLRKLDFITGSNKGLSLSDEVRKLFEPTIGIHQPSTGRSVRVNRTGTAV